MNKKGKIFTSIINSVLPILLAFIIGGIVIVVIGENPFETYWILP